MGEVYQLPDGNYEVRALDAEGKAGRFVIDEKTYRLLVTSGHIKPNNRVGPGPIANTVGIIVPKTSPNLSGSSAPTPKPEAKEEGWWKSWGSAVTHGVLDVVGLIPVAGEAANLIGAGIYLLEGDKVSAALDLAAAWPAGGQAATAAKYGVKGAEKVVKEGAQAAEKKVAQKAEKEAAEEAEKKAAKSKEGGNVKGKKKLKCGEYGKYGDLKKKTGDGKFDRDHIPSKAALKERARAINGGRELSAAQKQAIDNYGSAIAIPRQAHIDVSPTYGQTATDAAKDAKNLASSARRDVEAMLKEIEKYDADGNCKKAYQKAAAKILRMSNDDFNKALLEILKKVK